MSEPKNRAKKITIVKPGILHWTLQDDRIDFRGDAYAVEGAGRRVLIDPMPLEESLLKRLGGVEAICLTGSCHQRSAWRYRRHFGAKVYAPAGAEGLEEEPDNWYRDGDSLPGTLQAVHAPGPAEVHYVFLLAGEPGALFCADVLMREGQDVGFIPDEHQDDPARTRETTKRLLELPFEILCFAHGAPMMKDSKTAIRKALGE